MPFKIVRNDITKMNTEAIVNTANPEASVGTGCDSAIYAAAGKEALLNYRKEKIGAVHEGEVFLTPGFNLPAKYIIHAVSPGYKTGKEAELKLRSCYKKSLELAKKNKIKSISFPLIGAGNLGFPREEALRIAIDEVNTFLLKNDMDIIIVVFDRGSNEYAKKIHADLEAYIDDNYVAEKSAQEYDTEEYGSGFPYEINPPVKKTQPDKRRPDSLQIGSIRPDGIQIGTTQRGKTRPGSMRSGNLRPGSTKACNDFAENMVMDIVGSHFMASEYRSDEQGLKADEEEKDFPLFHESRLEERIRHMSDTYSEYLMYLIGEKKMKNADVWKNAIVDKKIFSKIKNNKNYHPNKTTALRLCIGARLNLDESMDLLARAGYALSPCDKTDIIFSYFIENKIYDMIDLDIMLEEYGCPCAID